MGRFLLVSSSNIGITLKGRWIDGKIDGQMDGWTDGQIPPSPSTIPTNMRPKQGLLIIPALGKQPSVPPET